MESKIYEINNAMQGRRWKSKKRGTSEKMQKSGMKDAIKV